MAAEQPVDRGEFADSRFVWGPARGRTRALVVGLFAFVLILVVVRLWLTRKIATPWIMSDELLYSELAKSLASGGGIEVREAFYPVYYVGYPVLIAPAWLAGSQEATYGLAKAINVLLMTSALVPVYVWARRLVSPVYATVATALTALMPSFVYTGMLMTENAFFPAFVLAGLAIALMLERPTWLRQALALGAVGLGAFVRSQGLVLALILPVAIVVKLLLDARVAPSGGRRHAVLREAARYAPLAAVYVAGGAGYVLYQLVQGRPLSTGLGAYSGITAVDYRLSDGARWSLEHIAELGLSVGLFPVSALVVLLGLAFLRGAESPAERAFLAVACAAVPLVVVQVAFYASWFSGRIEERYMFFLAPLLFIALAVWLDRGLPRPAVLTAIAVLGPAAPLLALPLQERLNISILSDTFTFIPLLRLSNVLDGGVPTVRWLVLLSAAAAVLAFAFVPRSLARPAFPAAIAIFFALTTYSVFGAVRDQSAATRALTQSAEPDWVDDHLPDGEEAAFVYGSTVDPFAEAVVMWQTEFWNRDVRTVYNLQPEPTSFAKAGAGIDRLTGRIEPQEGAHFPFRYVVANHTLGLGGQRLASRPPLALYRVRAPLRLVSSLEGVHPDGWMGADAALTQYTTPGDRPGTLYVQLSRRSWGGPDVPGRVTVELGKPVVRPDGAVGIGKVEARRTWVAHSRRLRTFRMRTPRPPFRVQIHIEPTFSPADFGEADTRELGVQVDLRFVD